jgi:Icc protein
MLIAHASDLHLGRDAATDRAARLLAVALEDAGVATTVVTGDVTHRGRASELALFEDLFGRLLRTGRMVVVPGNHDRVGDGTAADRLMAGGRVEVASRPGLHVVRLDSTAPHNRRLLSAHGRLDRADVNAVDSALTAAPEGALTVLALHHHLLPLPPDAFSERLSGLLGWPNAAELPLGEELLDRVRGKCDLVLHGHRHVPAARVLDGGADRPLRILNAGCTPDLGAFRVISTRAGRPSAEAWLEIDRAGSLPLEGELVGAA